MARTNKLSNLNKGSAGDRRWMQIREAMAVMGRDVEMMWWLWRVGLGTREQLQRLFFTAGGRSHCARRLTLLWRNHYISKVPGRPVNAPDIFYIGRSATRGLKLLRHLSGDESIAPRKLSPTKLEHTLEIANCRVALTLACKAQGFVLDSWLGEQDLVGKMRESSIIPDAYFQITRPTNDGDKHSAYFLEVERSGKSLAALEDKFRKLGDYYYQGHFESTFNIRALRVLMLFGSDYDINPERQIAKCMALCQNLEVTILRFAALEEFLGSDPRLLFTAGTWHQPKQEKLVSLF